jgi:hypothetical protein
MKVRLGGSLAFQAEHSGAGEEARPTPCQALGHAGGYFLAACIMAALYK